MQDDLFALMQQNTEYSSENEDRNVFGACLQLRSEHDLFAVLQHELSNIRHAQVKTLARYLPGRADNARFVQTPREPARANRDLWNRTGFASDEPRQNMPIDRCSSAWNKRKITSALPRKSSIASGNPLFGRNDFFRYEVMVAHPFDLSAAPAPFVLRQIPAIVASVFYRLGFHSDTAAVVDAIGFDAETKRRFLR